PSSCEKAHAAATWTWRGPGIGCTEGPVFPGRTDAAAATQAEKGFRGDSPPPPRLALRSRLSPDAERAGRRGPGAGRHAPRLPLLGQLRARLELQGVALQDPDEHLHQQLPEGQARARGPE